MNFNFYGHEFSYVRCALGISAFRILDQAYFAGSYHEIYGKYGNGKYYLVKLYRACELFQLSAYQSESTNQAEQIVAVILNIYHLLSIASFILLIYGAVALNAGCLKAWLHLAGFGVVTQYVLYIVLAVLTGKSIFELESLFTIIVLWTLAVLFLGEYFLNKFN